MTKSKRFGKVTERELDIAEYVWRKTMQVQKILLMNPSEIQEVMDDPKARERLRTKLEKLDVDIPDA